MKTLRFVIKILEFILIILCLAGLTWGIYYLLTFRTSPSTGVESQNNVVVIASTAPYQLLVTYPSGQKTGFDSKTGKEVIGIPGSKYYFKSEPPVPEPGSYWLGLTDPPDKFQLQVIGEPAGEFGFGIYVYRNNRQLQETFSGKITAKNSAVYEIKSAPSGKFFPLQVTLIK